MEEKVIDITGLNHYAIAVSELSASLSFYNGILGLKRIRRPDFDFAGAWLDSGNGIEIHLIQDGDRVSSAISGTRSLHFAFSVRDIHVFRTLLISQGIRIQKDIKHRPDGALQMFISDPDGYYIEITQIT
jgi:lactoylglutathione lyase